MDCYSRVKVFLRIRSGKNLAMIRKSMLNQEGVAMEDFSMGRLKARRGLRVSSSQLALTFSTRRSGLS
jgi:hypothetical protein